MTDLLDLMMASEPPRKPSGKPSLADIVKPAALPYVAGSETSRAAAQSKSGAAATERERVYSFLYSQGQRGATDEEIANALHMSGNTERPRRRELVQAGRVVETEQRRRTESGRAATVWAVRRWA